MQDIPQDENSKDQFLIQSKSGGTQVLWNNVQKLKSEPVYKNSACGSGRSLSVWNLPASECISRTSTRAYVQDVVFDENQILVVGAEPLLSRFEINEAILSQMQCAPPQSAFSVSLHTSGVTAIGGYGGVVDVISQFGSHLCTVG
ncbi:THO complex subunit 6-like [Rosa rugosa]|uniref:THO complex subunit 6-like n=1 Tax=Rosa rugosa TaxID=74645 RepID=UPI002B40E863|nr:THO complex subunit 6-like [Rosa rugosa]